MDLLDIPNRGSEVTLYRINAMDIPCEIIKGDILDFTKTSVMIGVKDENTIHVIKREYIDYIIVHVKE